MIDTKKTNQRIWCRKVRMILMITMKIWFWILLPSKLKSNRMLKKKIWFWRMHKSKKIFIWNLMILKSRKVLKGLKRNIIYIQGNIHLLKKKITNGSWITLRESKNWNLHQGIKR